MAIPNVTGKTAIVTGAGSGINLAFAELLLSKGCNVVFADLALRPEAQAVVDAYPLNASSSKAKAFFQPTDVTSWLQLERAFSSCEEHFGSADIVCPGAGVYEPAWSNFWIPPGTPPSIDDPAKDRYASFDILITHPVRATQLAISHFLKHKKAGSVVHISSIAAQSPGILCPLYITAKHALSGFVRCMAKLEQDGDPEGRLLPIRVTAVAPGVIKTPLWTDNPDKLKWIDELQDTWVGPDEVAQVMYDLVVKDEYVGGTVLEVAKNIVRRVETCNDPGPGTKAGATASGRGDGRPEVWDKLARGGWGVLGAK